MAHEHSSPDNHKDGVAEAGTSGGRFARLLVWIRQRTILVASIVLGIIGLATTLSFIFSENEKIAEIEETASALAALGEGQDLRADALAKELLGRGAISNRDRGIAMFVQGAVACHRADRMSGAPRIRVFGEAAKQLLSAAEAGLPADYEAQALLLLGRSLLYSGQPQASRIPLEQALKTNPDDQSQIERLLADAYSQEPKALPAKALVFIDRYLGDDRIDGLERQKAELLRAEILLKLTRFSEARKSLAALLLDSPVKVDAQIIDAQVDLEEARQIRQAAALADRPQEAKAHELLQKTIEKLRALQANAPRDHDVVGNAMYLTGLCYLELGDSRAALDQFERTYKRYTDASEGWAALVEIATIKLQSRADDSALQSLAEALRIYRQRSPQGNPWLSQQEFNDRLVKVCGEMISHGAFASAIALAETMSPPIGEDDARELTAKTYQTWGRRLLADAARLAPNEAKNQKRQARAKLRMAGKLFDQLATRRFSTRFYPNDRWNAAESYLEAQNYPMAIVYLREFLARAPRPDRPMGLLALGKAQLSLGKYAAAIATLQECIEFHSKHPAQFEARILRSYAYLEQGNFDAAASSLRENLEGDLLSPTSKEWRESLFALARIEHETGRYGQAMPRLQEALERYPDDHQALTARYLLADCHLQLAARYATQLERELVEETRRWLIESRRRAYEQAVTYFGQTIERLHDRETSSELSASDRTMERASLFNHAAALFSLDRFPQAIDAYNAALARFPMAPESLAAYVQIALSHRRLGHADEAQNALSLAKVALDRLPAEAPFLAATGMSRAGWHEYLAWLRVM